MIWYSYVHVTTYLNEVFKLFVSICRLLNHKKEIAIMRVFGKRKSQNNHSLMKSFMNKLSSRNLFEYIIYIYAKLFFRIIWFSQEERIFVFVGLLMVRLN